MFIRKVMNLSNLSTITILLFLIIYVSKLAYNKERSDNVISFGESLDYDIEFLFLDVGKATIIVDKSAHEVDKKSCYKIEVKGWTSGVFSYFTKVKDRWVSYIDTQTNMPQKFFRDIHENTYKIKETTHFDHTIKEAKVEKFYKGSFSHHAYPIPSKTQDIISSYFFLRNLDLDNHKKGDIFFLNTFFEDTSYTVRVRYLKDEILKTKIGSIDCIVLSPIMPKNRLFNGENSINLWISKDANRLPLKIKANLFIGSATIELVDYKNLKYPIEK